MEIEKLIDQISDEIYQKIQGESKPVKAGEQESTKPMGSIAGMIDHTLLKANASADQIKKICEEALQYHFASVCVNTCYVPLVAKMLKGSGVNTCCVVGFPLGAASTRSKAEEAREAVANGANEVDMVISVGAIKSGDWNYVKNDIAEVVKTSREGGAIVKVIIEACLLTDEEKVLACKASKEAGASFVKTSTGFSTGGATVEDIRLMRKTVGPAMGVKASGGIKSYKDAMDMIRAGANRIGASCGIEIVRSEAKEAGGAPLNTSGISTQNYPGSNMQY